jgi:predicted AlkP superfamily pyrophosphatase or phosphodiesterase
MTHRTVVINAVGLTPELLAGTPKLNQFAQSGKCTPINAALPAVTCTAQANYVTGTTPSEHGIVANGWYFRDECEVKFWRQSNKLVQRPKIWEVMRQRDPNFTSANMFWWYNMYSTVDYAVTPRPMYPSDGRKLPDIYSQPGELRPTLQKELGEFPLFQFWGPNTTVKSTQWIADASKYVEEKHSPTFTLIYLPHLDYVLQRLGPGLDVAANDLKELDDIAAGLIEFYEKRGVRVIMLSEYGITPVDTPVHINQALRKAGLIEVREELGLELLDAGVSQAFAASDHQIAHVYVNDPSVMAQVRGIIEKLDGVAQILETKEEKAAHGLDHPRSGELIVLAKPNAWFTYYYWLDDARAPDFARTVDIHRKPGYDPVELFIDPAIRNPKLKAGMKLMRKKLGFRYLMDLTPLDATLVKGSHGVPTTPQQGPLLLTRQKHLVDQSSLDSTQVYNVMMRHLVED